MTQIRFLGYEDSVRLVLSPKAPPAFSTLLKSESVGVYQPRVRLRSSILRLLRRHTSHRPVRPPRAFATPGRSSTLGFRPRTGLSRRVGTTTVTDRRGSSAPAQ